MAISKSAKIQAEIEKVMAKINEQQARLKELEQKKLEAENSEIVEIVRGMSVSLTAMPHIKTAAQSAAVSFFIHLFIRCPPYPQTSGHSVPKCRRS